MVSNRGPDLYKRIFSYLDLFNPDKNPNVAKRHSYLQFDTKFGWDFEFFNKETAMSKPCVYHSLIFAASVVDFMLHYRSPFVTSILIGSQSSRHLVMTSSHIKTRRYHSNDLKITKHMYLFTFDKQTTFKSILAVCLSQYGCDFISEWD